MDWIKFKKNKILVVSIASVCVVIGCVITVALTSDKRGNDESNFQNSLTSQTTATTETTKTTETTATTETQTSTDKEVSSKVTTTKKNNNNGGSAQKPIDNKITYITGDTVLKINGQTIYMPQYSYIAVNSPKLYKNKQISYSILKSHASKNYFDKSVNNYATMNRAIELEKDFYWTNVMAKKYGIQINSSSSYYDPSWSNDEMLASSYISDFTKKSSEIMKKMLADGTLKVSESEKNDFIRKRTIACSYINLYYPLDTPSELIETEKAYIRSVFGKNGINSQALSSSIANDLNARAEKIKVETGYSFVYTVMYEPAQMVLPENSGIASSKFNEISEKEEAREYTIKIYYDPINHLKISDAEIKSFELEIVKDDYIKLKKKAIDEYSVALNKESYISRVSGY